MRFYLASVAATVVADIECHLIVLVFSYKNVNPTCFVLSFLASFFSSDTFQLECH